MATPIPPQPAAAISQNQARVRLLQAALLAAEQCGLQLQESQLRGVLAFATTLAPPGTPPLFKFNWEHGAPEARDFRAALHSIPGLRVLAGDGDPPGTPSWLHLVPDQARTLAPQLAGAIARFAWLYGFLPLCNQARLTSWWLVGEEIARCRATTITPELAATLQAAAAATAIHGLGGAAGAEQQLIVIAQAIFARRAECAERFPARPGQQQRL